MDIDEAVDVLKKLNEDSAVVDNRKLSITRAKMDKSLNQAEQMMREHSKGNETITKEKFIKVAMKVLFP